MSLGSQAFAQGPPGSSQPKRSKGDDASENGWGVIGRTGHLGFKTFGRDTSISPVEIMPYLLEDEHFFFADVRGFVSNQSEFGGNAGLGYRYLDEGMMSWYGGNIFYDVDNTTGELFHQIGFGFEAAIEIIELRTNFYIPVGDTEKQFSRGTLAARFENNQLLFDSTSRFGTAMKGVDFEVGSGLPVPVGPFGSDLRGYVGGYFFNGGDADNITGFKARAELDITHTVTTQLLYTNDGTFGSNVMVGAQVEFPWGGSHPSSSWKRAMPSPYRYVERNYNVIVGETRSEIQGIVAINPATGLPYEVQHVSSTGTPGGDGSPDDAWATVAQAQSAGGDLIWVHSGTTLTEQITVQNGQFVLGEAPGQTLVAQGYGTIQLPGGPSAGPTAAPLGSPLITGVSGPAVTLGSNSTFSGFTIDGVTGDGIVSSGASNVNVSNVTLKDITGDAMRLTNSSGNVSLQNVEFQSISGRGLVIDGGNANVTATAKFTNVTGDALTIEDTTGGSVTLTDINISHSGGRGLVGTNLGGGLITDDLTITQITGDAIVINGTTESVTFGGVTKIEDSLARGMVLNGLNPTEVENVDKAITIEDLQIKSASTGAALTITDSEADLIIKNMTLNLTKGAGMVVDNVDELTINKGTIKTTENIAVDISDSNTDINLTWIDANDGPVAIRIVDSTGGFVVNGQGKLGSGGVIQNMDTAVILDNAGTVGLRYMNFVNNTNGITSANSDYVVLDYLQIGGTTNYAVDSRNDSLHSISNSYLAENGALGGGTIRYRADAFGTYVAQIVSSTIIDNNGTPISYAGLAGSEGSSLNYLMDGTVVQANRGGVSAFDVQWNGPIGLTINGSEFTLNEANQRAVNVVGTSTTDRLTAAITNNIINADDTSAVGLRFIAAGTSTLNIVGNGIAFNGGNGIGMQFNLADDAMVLLDTNAVIDNAFGATGFLFDDIAAGSTVRIDGNSMQFKSTGVVVDRGIIFTSMGETVQLQGTRNNVIQGATTPFQAPSGKSTGSFRLNGATVQ
ncbi:MAG TPA: right-handed parallel beta-helix repeat-containing protein [Caulifigura sp.]|nr:right-handed parallel beta-helix repeat-containing protein [Caulifigura sp.]